ncbi:MAG: acetyl-CoA synthetase [Haloquadratum sp.]
MNVDSGPDGGGSRDGELPPPCPDPDVVGDLVARDRRTGGLALRAAVSGRSYSYRSFVTTAYKAGNVLRYLGVRAGDEVLVVPDAVPEPALAFYGAAQLGAVTRFGGTVGEEPPRVVLAPTEQETAFDLPPGHHLAVHGGEPSDPSTTHWESVVWGENPAVHPATVEPGDPLLVAGDRTYTHAELLAAASSVVTDANLRPGDAVMVRAPLSDPAVATAGLLAPIAAGATVVLPDETSEEPPETDAESVVVVAEGGTDAARTIDPAAVPIPRPR